MEMSSRFDSGELRQVLGTFVTGVTVVTTVDEGGRFHGLTANSFSSVSLDPPLVLWSQSLKGPSHRVFSTASFFAVNILAEDQIALSNRFASSSADKFEGIKLDRGLTGLPLLRNCSAWLECEMVSKIPGGDHTIYVGKVVSVRRTSRDPLLFGSGKYLVADPHDLAPRPAPEQAQGQLTAVQLGTRAMSRLARAFDTNMALSVWGSHGPTITIWQPGSRPVSNRLPVGLTLPVTTTATGLAFAASLPEADAFVTHERRVSGQTEQDWKMQMADVRRNGLAQRLSGRFCGGGPRINALSAAVIDDAGKAVIAMTAVGDAEEFRPGFDGPFAYALKTAAEDLSARLGYVTTPSQSVTMARV